MRRVLIYAQADLRAKRFCQCSGSRNQYSSTGTGIGSFHGDAVACTLGISRQHGSAHTGSGCDRVLSETERLSSLREQKRLATSGVEIVQVTLTYSSILCWCRMVQSFPSKP